MNGIVYSHRTKSCHFASLCIALTNYVTNFPEVIMRPDTLHIASMSGKKEKNIERMKVALPSISSYQMKKVSLITLLWSKITPLFSAASL